MNKEDIIKQINECDIQKIKLVGKLELLEEQEKEKMEDKPEVTGL